METQVAGKEPNWDQVLDTYGAEEYTRQKHVWETQQGHLSAAREQQAAANAEANAAHQQAQADMKARESALLMDAIPELQDPKRAETFSADVSKYMETRGFKADEIGSTLENTLDHRFYLILQDAMKYGTLKAGEPATAKKVKKLPKVLKPNAKKGSGQLRSDNLAALSKNLRRSGSMDDAADVFKGLGI